MEGQFLIRQIYDDEITYNIIGAAVDILNIPADDILELFGKTFFEFCQDSGYDKILQVLGATPRDFLQNLDALHDHLGTLYPGMRAPSFRCTEENDGSLILHYYSERPGLEHIVIGIVKAVALKLHGVDVDIKIIKRKGDSMENTSTNLLPTNSSTSSVDQPDSSCIQTREQIHKTAPIDIMVTAVEKCSANGNGNLLEIQADCRCCLNQCNNGNTRTLQKNVSSSTTTSMCKCLVNTTKEILSEIKDPTLTECQLCNSSEIQTPSNSTVKCNLNDVETKNFGRTPHICDSENGQHKHQCFELIQQKSEDIELSDHIQFLITEISAPAAPSIEEKEPPDDVDVLTEGSLISTATFCRIFPFHIMFDRQMNVVQVGKSVSRVIPRLLLKQSESVDYIRSQCKMTVKRKQSTGNEEKKRKLSTISSVSSSNYFHVALVVFLLYIYLPGGESHIASIIGNGDAVPPRLSQLRISRGPTVSPIDVQDTEETPRVNLLHMPSFQPKYLRRETEVHSRNPVYSRIDGKRENSQEEIEMTEGNVISDDETNQTPTYLQYISARALSNIPEFFKHLRDYGEIPNYYSDFQPERSVAVKPRWKPPASGHTHNIRSFVQPPTEEETNYNPSWLYTNLGLGKRRR